MLMPFLLEVLRWADRFEMMKKSESEGRQLSIMNLSSVIN
jgi:hypothetical protein